MIRNRIFKKNENLFVSENTQFQRNEFENNVNDRVNENTNS